MSFDSLVKPELRSTNSMNNPRRWSYSKQRLEEKVAGGAIARALGHPLKPIRFDRCCAGHITDVGGEYHVGRCYLSSNTSV